ncbi:hypothetical protein [uncultured Thiothrix sp.]|uniref:hypothetical protein n=1 Tax=uncultured Thiothrix sp. TaxID=223185 RepID=UPI002629335D|nr:hypothetical protein [uncultured Thiothrix sp.]
MKHSYLTWGLAASFLVGSTSLVARDNRPDLADLVIGQYHGEVTSDSRGSSKTDVNLTVTKKSPTSVLVTSDYARLGSVVVPLEALPNRIILAASGKSTFLWDGKQRPVRLDYSPDGSVAYVGYKQ